MKKMQYRKYIFDENYSSACCFFIEKLNNFKCKTNTESKKKKITVEKIASTLK